MSRIANAFRNMHARQDAEGTGSAQAGHDSASSWGRAGRANVSRPASVISRANNLVRNNLASANFNPRRSFNYRKQLLEWERAAPPYVSLVVASKFQ